MVDGGRKLGEILVEQGLAPAEGVAAVLAKPGAGRLASELLRLGVASERALAIGLAEQRGHPAVVLSESSLELAALEMVPRFIAEQHRLLPIAIDSDTLTLAVAELTTKEGRRPAIYDQIEFASGRTPRLLLALDTVIAEATVLAYQAHRAGETVLVGHTPRPAGEATHTPLAVVRPGASRATAAMDDPLLPADMPAMVDEPLPTQDAVADTATPAVPAAPVVLLVDDDDDIRALARKVLGFDGYQMVEARSGREAMERLRTLRPQLIVLDAMLPEIHGFDICATLKRSDTFAHTPIIVVSAVYRGWENARTVQETHGADAFVEKPFDVHYLRELAARLVGRQLPRAVLGPELQRKVRALLEEATVAYRLGDLPAALDAIKRWRAQDPFDANAWLTQGAVCIKQGDLDGAMKAYERAATFDSHSFTAFKNLALIYDRLGFLQRAQMAWYRSYELAGDAQTRQQIEARLARR